MSVVRILARSQAAHKRLLMLDTIVIDRKTQGAFNPTTGQYAVTWTTVYAGPADVKPTAQRARGVDAGETITAVGRYDVKVPFDIAGLVKVEDRLTATASPDAHLVGRTMYVLAVMPAARRSAWHVTAVDQEQP